MWNGDGKTVVWAFRIGFFRKFAEEHPDCRMDDNSEYWQIYDCVDEVPGEDLDCWYCDECKGLTVFVDISRYDFKRMDVIPSVNIDEIIEEGKLYRGRDINTEGLPVVELKHEAISSLVGEICKSVTVETVVLLSHKS